VLTSRVKEKYLKYAIGVLLTILGLKMIHGALVPKPTGELVAGYSIEMLAFGAVLGLLIGIVCESLGVAGGELRIPPLDLPLRSIDHDGRNHESGRAYPSCRHWDTQA